MDLHQQYTRKAVIILIGMFCQRNNDFPTILFALAVSILISFKVNWWPIFIKKPSYHWVLLYECFAVRGLVDLANKLAWIPLVSLFGVLGNIVFEINELSGLERNSFFASFGVWLNSPNGIYTSEMIAAAIILYTAMFMNETLYQIKLKIEAFARSKTEGLSLSNLRKHPLLQKLHERWKGGDKVVAAKTPEKVKDKPSNYGNEIDYEEDSYSEVFI